MSHEGDEPSLPFIMFVLSSSEKTFFFSNEDVSESITSGQLLHVPVSRSPLTHKCVSVQIERREAAVC